MVYTPWHYYVSVVKHSVPCNRHSMIQTNDIPLISPFSLPCPHLQRISHMQKRLPADCRVEHSPANILGLKIKNGKNSERHINQKSSCSTPSVVSELSPFLMYRSHQLVTFNNRPAFLRLLLRRRPYPLVILVTLLCNKSLCFSTLSG